MKGEDRKWTLGSERAYMRINYVVVPYYEPTKRKEEELKTERKKENGDR